MKRKTLVAQTLLFAMSSLFTSSQASQGLMCYSDYIDVLTCEWKSSKEDCYVSAYTKRNAKRQSETVTRKLVPLGSSQPGLHRATLQFTSRSLLRGSSLLSLTVKCAGATDPVESISDFEINENVKLNPPLNLTVDAEGIKWKYSCPSNLNSFRCKFQLQFKVQGESWENVSPVNLTEKQESELPEEKLILGGKYVARVRTIPTYFPKHWSDWSSSIEWKSAVGRSPPEPSGLFPWLFPSLTGTAIIVVVAVFLLGLLRIHSNTCLLKAKHIPDPSLYFKDLNSSYKGDFKSWLGPILTPDSFLKADSESIFPVEVHKIQYSIKSEADECPKGDVKTASFSNSSYFLSQSSKCPVLDQLEPCLPQSPYGPPVSSNMEEKALFFSGGSHNNDTDNESGLDSPIETSSSYKHLANMRVDVQSPDSGFSAGAEDQDCQEEGWSEELPSPPVVDNFPPMSKNLSFPVPLAPNQGGFSHLFFPGTCVNMLMISSDLGSCSGNIELSSGDYMPVKRVQEEE